MQLLQRLNRELNKTLIVVTHDPLTSHYADKTLHLEKGRLIESPDVATQNIEQEPQVSP